MIDGLCKHHVEPDMWFFPPEFDRAKALCLECPFMAGCFEGAVERKEQFGVWGATTPRERGYRHSEDGVSDYEPL